jgi:mannan endo-1,4-beta-mannosidase
MISHCGRKRTMGIRIKTCIAVAGSVLATACATSGTASARPVQPATVSGGTAASAAPATASPRIPFVGVYEAGAPGTYAPVTTFATTIGREPNVVLYFSSWYEKFQAAFAQKAYQHGASVDIDIDPYHVSVAAIAGGKYDAFLRSYAAAVKKFGHRVIISFGHEPNGKWYSWGYTHTRPAVWTAAWKHVVTVFRRAGATNVTWLWIIQQNGAGEGPIRDWWPGGSYVNWVGIDGYYETPGQTFRSMFVPTLTAIRKFTAKPVFISETAVGQQAGRAAKIPGLFTGLRARHLLGLLWFDKSQYQGVHHQAWRIEGHPAEAAAFRQALRG